ncbi:MAG: SURF1 family protein [Rhodospirillales bacterium]|nr:SURF1 family protein [Rhodospirillales bacterium]
MSKTEKATDKTTPIPFWATLLTLLGLCILIALGTWQLQRLTWKKDIIAKIETAYATETPSPIEVWTKLAIDYEYGTLTGHLIPDKAFLLGPPTIRNDIQGYDLIVPLQVYGQIVLINFGWTDKPISEQPINHLKNKKITFTGLMKQPTWNYFTPHNQPEKNIWYRLDIKQIEQAKSLELIPGIFLAESSDHKFDDAFFNDEAQNRPLPNNNHLQYAFFWFAMALGLLTIYVLRFMI